MPAALRTLGRVMLNVGIAIDQGINCLWRIPGDEGDGWGHPDEMISARAFRAYMQDLIGPWPMAIINGLFFWQFQVQRDSDAGQITGLTWDHCHRAWRTEHLRKQLPTHYRD